MTRLWSSKIKNDPEAFVLFAFPWGQPNTPLAHHKGPRQWQRRLLRKIAEHIRNNDNPAAYRVFRYHLGSVAFGSFIIATVQLFRIMLMALDKHTKQLQEKNKMVKYAMKCMQCCLFCLEKILKFITDYCYIYVAVQVEASPRPRSCGLASHPRPHPPCVVP